MKSELKNLIALVPIEHETVWGGSRLSQTFSKDKGKKIGHLYSVLSTNDQSNKIFGTIYHLNDILSNYPHLIKLNHEGHLPFKVALVDAAQDLSIQIHPNDIYANEYLNLPLGKNESWYFIDKPSMNYIFGGIDTENPRTDLKSDQTIIAKLAKIYVKEGDYVYVENGTVHALTAGSFVYEIEENCDITYRLFDYDRVQNGKPRKLDLDLAISNINLDNRVSKKCYDDFNNFLIAERKYFTKLVLDSRYINLSDSIEFATIIDGSMIFEDSIITTGWTLLMFPGSELPSNNCQFIISGAI